MVRLRYLFAFVALLGCQPEIGDECQSSTDCAAGGDRLCDITQPGGYCTIFNCEPDTCPEEAACVLFSASPSTVAGCEDATGTSPFQRSFCMKSCESEDDCRAGYNCIDVGELDNPWGAIAVDGGSGRVCIVPYTAAPIPEDRSSEVCSGTDQEFEMPLEPEPEPPSGGAGGEGGEGGAPVSSSAGAGGS
jgi:hypothetical protein